MNQKTTYSLILFIILTLSIIVSCKSEKSKTSPVDPKDKTTNILDDNNEVKPTAEDIIASNEEKLTESQELSDSIKNNSDINDAEKSKVKDKVTSSPQGNVDPPVKIKPRKKKLKNKKQPQIEFEELVWDFGEITEGDIIEKKFKFTNTGNAPLEIIATSATCGCTRPSFPFLEIAPGESNVIGVNYNSVGKNGVQNPEVTIESNTNPKTTIIKLHGTVKPKNENIPSLVKDSIKLNH